MHLPHPWRVVMRGVFFGVPASGTLAA